MIVIWTYREKFSKKYVFLRWAHIVQPARTVRIAITFQQRLLLRSNECTKSHLNSSWINQNGYQNSPNEFLMFIVENLTPTNCKSVVNNRNGSTSSDMTCFVLIVLDTIRSHSANQGVTAVIVTAATTPVYVTVPPVHRNHRHADC